MYQATQSRLGITAYSEDNHTPRWVKDLYMHELVIEDDTVKSLYSSTASYIKEGSIILVRRGFNIYVPSLYRKVRSHVYDYAVLQVQSSIVDKWQDEAEYSIYENESKDYLLSLDKDSVDYRVIKPKNNSNLLLLAANKDAVDKLQRWF